jgi:leader peptidase (prepilin peptidase)/N-methyltransferase
MTAAILAGATGVPAGLLIDAIASRLALEWHQGEPGSHNIRTAEPPFLLASGAAWRTVTVVVLAAGLSALVGARYGWGWELAAAGTYVCVLLACTETDLLAFRIPNVLVYPAIVLALAVGLVAPEADASDVLTGGALSGGIFLVMALLPGGGMGDAKLGLFTGLALGLDLVIPAVLITALSGGAIAATILVLSRMRALHTPIPYGPYIALGAVVVMLTGGTAFVRV